jgi:NTP pyrophosphatase (non-canonical NTP hydrolase)
MINYKALDDMCVAIHDLNKTWWHDPATGEPLLNRNVPEMLCLIHSEISEAMEAHRKDLMDDKLPKRKGIEVELADALIRICDTAEGLDLDLAGAVRDKLVFNASRADHKPENRIAEGGKAY